MSETRFDSYPIKLVDKVGANGYLTIPAIITRAGVFSYKQADGSVIKELRHPDEVFKPASLNTLKNVPLITEADHMRCISDGVPVNRVSEFTTLGVLGNQLKRTDKDEVETEVTVYRPDTMQKIDSGEERELSAGYTVDINKTPGEYNGEQYHQAQTNIIYGHAATVRRGRAGTAGFRIDSQAAILSTETQEFKKEDSVDKTIIKTKEIPALTIGKGEHGFRLDSLSVEESQGTLDILAQRNTLINKCEESHARADRAEGERDQLKADKERLEKELKDSIPKSRLDAEIEESALLIGMCDDYGIDPKGKTNIERKRAICLKQTPGLDEKRLDGAFLDGVFAPIRADREQKAKEFKTLDNLQDSLTKNPVGGKTPIQYPAQA